MLSSTLSYNKVNVPSIKRLYFVNSLILTLAYLIPILAMQSTHERGGSKSNSCGSQTYLLDVSIKII